MERRINILILVLIILTVTFVIYTNLPLSKEVIPARFILGEKTGFDLTPGELSFGSIEKDQGATRDILISNNFEDPIKITIKSRGEVSNNLIVSENNFRLNPSESRNVTFSISTKGLTEFKEYSGEVIIISRRV